MSARSTSLLLVAALVVYFVLLTGRAIALLETGTAVGVGLGVGVLLLPVVGAWVTVATIRFGFRAEQLARRLDEEGGLPETSELPRMPSGRIQRDAADAWFEERRAEVEAAPEDWRAWFRLAHGYDIAGDRRRAREAMRRAFELS
ncbi:tetratricopeptide repeat protein [Kibdelosporangium lantanae]